MEKEEIQELLLFSEGFHPLPGNNEIPQEKTDKIFNPFEFLYQNNPITILKTCKMFDPRSKIEYQDLNYLNCYDFNMNDRIATYLYSITFLRCIQVNDHKIILTDRDITFNCPIYYLLLTDVNGKILNNQDYSIILYCGSRSISLKFKHGFFTDEDNLYHSLNASSEYCFNKYQRFYNLIRKNPSLSNCFIGNDYTDRIEIRFDPNLDMRKVTIECKVYNLYGYGGFFKNGWLYSIH